MAFQAVPNTALVEIRGTLNGSEIENTLYFQKAGGYIMADLNDLAALVRAWWFDTMMVELTAGYVFREVKATDLSSADGAVAYDTAMSGTPGSNASPAMPGNVAIAVSFRTGLAGRSFRGRNYVSGLGENQFVGNEITDAARNAVQLAYEALLDVLSDTDFVWSVVSRVTAGLPRVVGLATQVVSVLIVDAFVDSQRRRLTGRGS